MNTASRLAATAFAAIICCFTACKKDLTQSTAEPQSLQDKIAENGTSPDEAIFTEQQNESSVSTNHFYVESNRKSKNSIFVFAQRQNGQLILTDEVASGGAGYGDGLGSQGAIAICPESRLLFAVNAASNSLSSFRINQSTGGLQLLFTANSYGQMPVSISVHGDKLFVLNALSSTICGYSFTEDGFLTKIEGSEYGLSTTMAGGAQIAFSPDGYALYVTEKETNIIDKFMLDEMGAVTSVVHVPSKGVEPFGFDYARNKKFLVVSNAANGASGAGSCTSYSFTGTGLQDVNGAVSNFASAPCWVATAKYGVFAFVSNTASNNVSSYYVDKNGALTLIKASAAADGSAPIDIVVSADNKYVCNIYSGTHMWLMRNFLFIF